MRLTKSLAVQSFLESNKIAFEVKEKWIDANIEDIYLDLSTEVFDSLMSYEYISKEMARRRTIMNFSNTLINVGIELVSYEDYKRMYNLTSIVKKVAAVKKAVTQAPVKETKNSNLKYDPAKLLEFVKNNCKTKPVQEEKKHHKEDEEEKEEKKTKMVRPPAQYSNPQYLEMYK